MLCAVLLSVAVPLGAERSDEGREALRWALSRTNRDVYYVMRDFGPSEFYFDGPFEERRERFRHLRGLPPFDAARLGPALLKRLRDPERFVAAQVLLWDLYGPPRRPLHDGQRLLQALDFHYGTIHTAIGEDLGVRGEPVVFPDPERQQDRLQRWWEEYFRGERTIFFEAGKDRPDAPPELYDGKSWHILAAYQRFLPPRPANFGEMSIRELEAYYGAPPAVPEGFDPDAAPPNFAPPPVPGWRERAGLPPAE